MPAIVPLRPGHAQAADTRLSASCRARPARPTLPCAPMEELAHGALLGGGRYRIDVKLDAGGMGSVYRALDLKTSSLVAIKLVHEELARDATIRERFRREAMAAAALVHAEVERGRTFM